MVDNPCNYDANRVGNLLGFLTDLYFQSFCVYDLDAFCEKVLKYNLHFSSRHHDEKQRYIIRNWKQCIYNRRIDFENG